MSAVGRVTGPHGADEIGPVLLDQVRELLGHRRVRVLPVLDLAGDPSTSSGTSPTSSGTNSKSSVDSYEIPERMRTLVELRDETSRFPFATTPARACHLDHTDPWRRTGPAGQTRPANLVALHLAGHRAKHHGWRLTRPQPGRFDWVSPLGYHYRVDHAGTTRTGSSRGPQNESSRRGTVIRR